MGAGSIHNSLSHEEFCSIISRQTEEIKYLKKENEMLKRHREDLREISNEYANLLHKIFIDSDGKYGVKEFHFEK